MFRFLLALLLVNAFGRSFVSPLPTMPNGSLVSDLLASLATKCDHPFLSTQLNSKLKDCSVQLPPFNEKQFECLTFYDINKQLCDAVTTAELALTVNDTAKLDEAVDIDKLCSMAKHWNVTNIIEYPTYKKTVEQIFNSQATCVKVCGVAEILSQDVNAFCKYFKWGSEMLSPKISAISTNNGDIYVPPHPSDNILLAVSPSKDAPNLSEPSKDVNTAKTTKVKPGEPAKIDEAIPVVSIQEWSTNKVAPSSGSSNVSEKNPVESNGSESSAPQEVPVDSPVNIDTINAEMEKPSAAEVPPVKKEDEVKLEDVPKNKSVDEKESSPVNEKSKSQNEDLEDYQGDPDLDEGKDLTLTDTQGGDDGEDPMLSDPDIKQDLNLPKKPTKKIESMVSYNNGEMELFPNAMQEGFSDDDDHFFSFFLTAVVLVVLLYVLYHNKNKVSKVVLGLIVEGRQSGRRRNSRGHAYRRLDTLEQAMSANTAAPPSKIIY